MDSLFPFFRKHLDDCIEIPFSTSICIHDHPTEYQEVGKGLLDFDGIFVYMAYNRYFLSVSEFLYFTEARTQKI